MKNGIERTFSSAHTSQQKWSTGKENSSFEELVRMILKKTNLPKYLLDSRGKYYML